MDGGIFISQGVTPLLFNKSFRLITLNRNDLYYFGIHLVILIFSEPDVFFFI